MEDYEGDVRDWDEDEDDVHEARESFERVTLKRAQRARHLDGQTDNQ